MAKLKVWKIFSVWLVIVLIAGLGVVIVPASPVEAQTNYYVSTTGNDGNDGTAPDDAHAWLTIQHAADNVTAGDIINVAAGTYTQSLTINKALTIQGAGSATTTINGAHTVTANNVNISGFNLSITGSATVITVNSTLSPISGFSVTNCVFNMPVSPAIGISIGFVTTPQKVSSVTINNNTFNGPANMGANPWKIGGQFGTPISCEVEGLIFQDNTVNRCSTPINLQISNITNILINNNTFANTDGAVYVWAQAGSVPTGKLKQFVFTNNNLSAPNTYGVAFIDGTAATSPFTNANFDTGNKVNMNDFSGITGTPPPFYAALGGVSLLGTVTPYTLDAESNWWGANDGPGGVGPGSGAPVSANVDYTPWLTRSGGTTSATGTGTVTFDIDAGGITGLTAVAEATLPTAGKPAGVTFPHGLFSFNIVGITAGSCVTVTITYPSPIPVGAQYWKFQNGIWIDCTSLLGDDDGDTVLTLMLCDGGLGDADGVANGTIVEPGGPAVVAVGAPAGPGASPTLQRPLNPAQMSLQYLSITPPQTSAGQPVIITTNVVNTGDEAGNYNVTLKINGQVEQTRMVGVGPHGAQPVKFTVTKDQPGTYNVDILGKSGSFTILGAGSSGTTGSKTGALIALALIGILIIATLVVLLLRRT
ncbi:choice-of-anchor U domain-containing protein [Chloroflexota bacterium]